MQVYRLRLCGSVLRTVLLRSRLQFLRVCLRKHFERVVVVRHVDRLVQVGAAHVGRRGRAARQRRLVVLHLDPGGRRVRALPVLRRVVPRELGLAVDAEQAGEAETAEDDQGADSGPEDDAKQAENVEA